MEHIRHNLQLISHTTPTLIKLNSKGDIQWYENTSTVLNLAIGSSNIQTSDGGFVYFEAGNGVLNPPNCHRVTYPCENRFK